MTHGYYIGSAFEKHLHLPPTNTSPAKNASASVNHSLVVAVKACVGCFIVFNHPLSLHRCMEDFSTLGGRFRKYPKELKFEGQHKLKVQWGSSCS